VTAAVALRLAGCDAFGERYLSTVLSADHEPVAIEHDEAARDRPPG
jgi:hypothetical protein